MLRSVLPFGMAALVLVSMPTGSGGARALPLGAGPRAPEFAFVYDHATAKVPGAWLARLDPRTMRVGKQRSPNLANVDAWRFDPAHRLLAVASTSGPWGVWPDVLRFVQSRTLSLTGASVKLAATARDLFWARPDRVVAVEVHCCGTPGGVIQTIDVATRRVVSASTFQGRLLANARGADKLVLLETPWNQIGAPTLHVISADGSDRTVVLARVNAGTSSDPTAPDPVATIRIPALVVDTADTHAFVVQPDGSAADVDLGTLAVSYHDLRAPSSLVARLSAWFTPAASAKGSNGPGRVGLWLGDGLIALTGSDSTTQQGASGTLEMSEAPAGVAIVDTNDWTIRTLDSDSDSVLVASHLLLTSGRVITPSDSSGTGLSAYGPDGSLKFRLFGRRDVFVAEAVAGRAYVVLAGLARVAVVDLRSGRVVGYRRDSSLPFPLIGDSSDGS